MDPRITEDRIREIMNRNWDILTREEAIEYETKRLQFNDMQQRILREEEIPEDENGYPERATRYASQILDQFSEAVSRGGSVGVDVHAGYRITWRKADNPREFRLIIPPTADFNISLYLFWEDCQEDKYGLVTDLSPQDVMAWLAWFEGGKRPDEGKES